MEPRRSSILERVVDKTVGYESAPELSDPDWFRRACLVGDPYTDSGVSPHGDNARELLYMVEAGMTPMDALKSATIEAATLLRQQSKLGSIEPGKAADIIAVEGDPLRDMKVMLDTRFVMKGGVAYKRPPES